MFINKGTYIKYIAFKQKKISEYLKKKFLKLLFLKIF